MTPQAATLEKKAPAETVERAVPDLEPVRAVPAPVGTVVPVERAVPAAVQLQKVAPRPTLTRPALGSAPPRIDRRLALWLGLGCPLVTAINIVIEPLPADPDAPVPVAASLLFLVFTAAVVGTAVYAARREARTLPVATFAGVLALVLTISCPASGHHTGIGLWWYTQMVLSIGFVAFSAVAWRRHSLAGG